MIAGSRFSHTATLADTLAVVRGELSRVGSMSCSTCHDRQRAFTDDRPVSVGVFGRIGTRNAPV